MDTPYEKWLWIDLLGFDKDRPDCAVPALLEKAGSVEVLSLLLHNAEFVHLHDRADGTRAFPPDVCSYGGHPRNEERDRQAWTPVALARLVAVLREHGIRVLFSVFDSGAPAGWRECHPEIGYVLRNGESSPRICPWKRLADGSFYEDFFVRQLRAVVRDYGFDGFHGADGYSHPRYPLHEADFSDDMIAQFLAATRVPLPPGIEAACAGRPGAVAERAEWIWSERRQDWIDFHTRRSARFWGKIAAMLHAEGKMLALNTAWTRDPFGAISRFGVDYRALAAAGADAFIVEAAGAVQELGGDLPYGTACGRSWTGWEPERILCRFQTTILSIKAAVPETRLVFLNGVKDTNEIWNGLRHAPTNIESEITMHANVFFRRADGALHRCTAGPVVCLADGIRSEEWRWLNQVWERAFEWPVRRVPGATVLWSDTALDREHAHYLSTRQCSPGRLLFELVARGAPLYTIQRCEELRETSDPLVILHPQLYARAELEAVFRYARGPVFLIGRRGAGGIPTPVREIFSSVDPGALWCGIYGAAAGDSEVPAVSLDRVDGASAGEMGEPPSWIYELPAPPLPSGFLSACAGAIAEISGAPRILENMESVRVWSVQAPSGTLRVFFRNDAFYYRTAKVDMRRPIQRLRVRTEFPGRPIPFEGAYFHVKIPGKGVVIADIDLA